MSSIVSMGGGEGVYLKTSMVMDSGSVRQVDLSTAKAPNEHQAVDLQSSAAAASVGEKGGEVGAGNAGAIDVAKPPEPVEAASSVFSRSRSDGHSAGLPEPEPKSNLLSAPHPHMRTVSCPRVPKTIFHGCAGCCCGT